MNYNSSLDLLIQGLRQEGSEIPVDIFYEPAKLLEACNRFVPEVPQRCQILDSVASKHASAHLRFGKTKELEVAIDLLRAAVNLTPSGCNGKLERLNNLGKLLLDRFRQRGDVIDVEAAICYQVQALEITSFDHPDRPRNLNNLGNSYLNRFRRFGQRTDLDLAIQHQIEAVQLTANDEIDRARFCSNLGCSLETRFKRFGTVDDIALAIDYGNEAVRLIALDSPRRPGILNNLACSYQTRFESLGGLADLESSITVQEEALSLTPENAPYKSRYLHNLGCTYESRFRRHGDVADIDSAIRYQTESLNNTPASHADRSKYCNNLGMSHRLRFERFGNILDIDTAVKYQTEAIEISTPESTNRPAYIGNLGQSLTTRYSRLRTIADIDAAIAYEVDAVRLTPIDSADRPRRLHNLACSLILRFKQSKSIDDVNAAVEHGMEAVALTPQDNTAKPRRLSTLGTSLRLRFQLSGGYADLEEAIKCQLESVELTPSISIERADRITDLGNSYLIRYIRLGGDTDSEIAGRHLAEAVNLTPCDSTKKPEQLNNLAFSLLVRMNNDKTDINRQRIIELFRLSSECTRGRPLARLDAALCWADFTGLGDIASTVEAHDAALRLLPEVVWIGLSAENQLEQFDTRIQSLACDAAACMLKLADSEPEKQRKHLGRAIEILELGRSILWSQHANLRGDIEDLRKANKSLADELESIGRSLAQSTFADSGVILLEEDAQVFRRQAIAWDDCMCRIRQLVGFEQFLCPLPFSELCEAANDGPIITINCSKYRCDAIIMCSDHSITAVHIAGSLKVIEELVDELHNAFNVFNVKIPGRQLSADGIDSKAAQLKVLHTLWTIFGGPIFTQLEQIGMVGFEPLRVWWCLTGPATFLPIHAAHSADLDFGMMDVVISSYIPTLTALLRAKKRKSTSFRMLAVGISEACDNFVSLPAVRKEMRMIEKLNVDATILKNSSATLEDVSSALSECSWTHFACHGVQDHDRPLNSGLILHNGRLNLSSLSRLPSKNAEFAYLSCCETATGTMRLPNESIHLAASMHFAGYRSVIGTMWSVYDSAAIQVAGRVYRSMLRDGAEKADSSKAAAALRKAVLFLRDMRKMPPSVWVSFTHFGF